jgi:hypothetical protein
MGRPWNAAPSATQALGSQVSVVLGVFIRESKDWLPVKVLESTSPVDDVSGIKVRNSEDSRHSLPP